MYPGLNADSAHACGGELPVKDADESPLSMFVSDLMEIRKEMP